MRKAAASLTVGALLFGGASALAGFAGGGYRGETELERPVSFRASKEKRRVLEFEIRVRYSCSDSARFWTTEDGFPGIRIRRARFGGTYRTSDGSYEATIRGALDGRRARGSYVAQRRYDRDGNLDPRGRVTCAVAKTSWSAKLR